MIDGIVQALGILERKRAGEVIPSAAKPVLTMRPAAEAAPAASAAEKGSA
jgi:hypothetical protein